MNDPDNFWTPGELTTDGDCPLCGNPLNGELGVHKECADEESFRSDMACDLSHPEQ